MVRVETERTHRGDLVAMRFSLLQLIFPLFTTGVLASDIYVNSPGELASAAKKAKPGDTLIIRNGTWKDQEVKLRLEGTGKQPVTLRTEHRESHVFTGKTMLSITGKHLVVDGLTFRDGYRVKEGNLIEIKGSHCRVTRCTIKNCNSKEPERKFHWLSLYGDHHRVDHCSFSGKKNRGVMLVVWLKDDPAGHHIIDHNHFSNYSKGTGNGFETMRIGTSHTMHKRANCLVYQNLFEHCDGEIEVISNKSTANTYLANTFFECRGCLTLRHGKNCLVSHNLFLGNGIDETGGVRVIGSGHRIIGNLFEKTDGRATGAISISAGIPDSPPAGYAPVDGGEIRSNIFRGNNRMAICFDHGIGEDDRSILPRNLVFEENIFENRPRSGVEFEPGKKAGAWRNNLYNESVPQNPSPWQLREIDVGPEARINARQDVIPNSHRYGEVDRLSRLAFCVPNPAGLSGTVVDETEAQLEGIWQYSTHTPPWVGVGYIHSKKGSTAPASATFPFTPDRRGRYVVQVSYCAKGNRSSQTKVTVGHAEGETGFMLDQREFPDGPHRLFRTLGSFTFSPGGKNYVRIESNPTERGVAIADAIRFVASGE